MPGLSHLEIAGSPRDAGQALGRFGAEVVHQYLLRSPPWATVMAWRGTDRVQAMAALTRERFPRVWSEIEGLAEGLDLPVDDVFLWNARGDVWAMVPDGCTTVQIPGASERRITHNEDGDPGFAGYCGIGQFQIEGSPRFASFAYPGSLPGHTFAVTDAGLAMTVNNLRLLHVGAGVPRMVLTRALLDAPSLAAAVSLIRETPRAGGFHLTLAHRASEELLGVEFGADFCSVDVIDAPAVHANHVIHRGLRDVPQIVTGSSGHRQMRGEQLLAQPAGAALDPLAILADRANSRFPIHREDPADSDIENTLASVDITVRQGGIECQVYEHPGEAARFVMRGSRNRIEPGG